MKDLGPRVPAAENVIAPVSQRRSCGSRHPSILFPLLDPGQAIKVECPLFIWAIDSNLASAFVLIKELRTPGLGPDKTQPKLKFFDSLIVALLPLDNNRMLTKNYGDTPQEHELRDAFRHD